MVSSTSIISDLLVVCFLLLLLYSETRLCKFLIHVDGHYTYISTGVIQAALKPDKNLIEVTGDGIDVVLLTTLLRKSLKYAEVVSVTPVEEKKEEKKDGQKLVWPPYMGGGVPVFYEVRDINYNHYQDPSCSIM